MSTFTLFGANPYGLWSFELPPMSLYDEDPVAWFAAHDAKTKDFLKRYNLRKARAERYNTPTNVFVDYELRSALNVMSLEAEEKLSSQYDEYRLQLAADESEEEPKDFYAWYRDYRAREFSRLYNQHVERVPPIQALVQEFVPPAWVEDVLQRIGAAAAAANPANASQFCRDFLGPANYRGTRVIAVVAMEKLVSCFERSFVFRLNFDKGDEERVLGAQATEVILQTMTHHAQFKTVQAR